MGGHRDTLLRGFDGLTEGKTGLNKIVFHELKDAIKSGADSPSAIKSFASTSANVTFDHLHQVEARLIKEEPPA